MFCELERVAEAFGSVEEVGMVAGGGWVGYFVRFHDVHDEKTMEGHV